MPSARYLTTFRNGRPDVPAGVFANGTDGYGWRVISHVPWGSCVVELISAQAVLDTTDTDPLYQRVEDYDATAWPAQTAGGAGGTVIHVTTLAASGAGSLAAALAAEGPRVIVFDVSGTIDLIGTGLRGLTITNPFVSIHGDTAPGGGVCIRGGLTIVTHDVIVRHLRIRPGPDAVLEQTNGIVLTDTADSYAYNVWIDHCSTSWATDENVTIYPTFGHIIENVTLSDCLIYEGLNDSTHPAGVHSMNMLLSNGWRDVVILRCLFALSVDRNPQIAGGVGEQARVLFANNIIYGTDEPPWVWGGVLADVVGNTIKQTGAAYDLELSSQENTVKSSSVHMTGNSNPARVFTVRHSNSNAPDYPRASSRLTSADVTIMSAAAAYADVLANAGAWPRDSSDARVVTHVEGGTGAIIDAPDDVGGWPTL